jgi:hypothetical protein
MAAAYQDLFLEQGTTFSTELTLTDSNGFPYDLNDFTIRGQARKSYYSSNVVINFTSVVANANSGIVTLTANSNTTAAISATQKLVYDVIITDQTFGTVTRVLEGQIFISPSVTR